MRFSLSEHGSETPSPPGGPLVLRVVASLLIGLISGLIVGFPASFILAEIIIRAASISSFEGGSGYAAMVIMMIGIPSFGIALASINAMLASRGWPKKVMITELIAAVLAMVVSVIAV